MPTQAGKSRLAGLPGCCKTDLEEYRAGGRRTDRGNRKNVEEEAEQAVVCVLSFIIACLYVSKLVCMHVPK